MSRFPSDAFRRYRLPHNARAFDARKALAAALECAEAPDMAAALVARGWSQDDASFVALVCKSAGVAAIPDAITTIERSYYRGKDRP